MNYRDIARRAFYGCLIGWVAFMALFFLALIILGLARTMMHPSNKMATLTDLSREHEITVTAPFLPFASGALFVLYEGTINTNAKLEITSNKGRDKTIIPLSAGEVSGVHGGGEEWSSDLSVRFIPNGPTQGTLKIAAICGKRFTKDEHEWRGKLQQKKLNR